MVFPIAAIRHRGDLVFVRQDRCETRRLQLHLQNSLSLPEPRTRTWGNSLGEEKQPGWVSRPAVPCATGSTAPRSWPSPTTGTSTPTTAALPGHGDPALSSPSQSMPLPPFTPTKTYSKTSTSRGILPGQGAQNWDGLTRALRVVFYDLEKVAGFLLDRNSSPVMGGLLFSWHARVPRGLIH